MRRVSWSSSIFAVLSMGRFVWLTPLHENDNSDASKSNPLHPSAPYKIPKCFHNRSFLLKFLLPFSALSRVPHWLLCYLQFLSESSINGEEVERSDFSSYFDASVTCTGPCKPLTFTLQLSLIWFNIFKLLIPFLF